MLKKVIYTLIVFIACLSLLLPFQEYKSMWADFDPSGLLSGLDPNFNANRVNKGYELILPYFSIILLSIGAFFTFVYKATNSKKIGVVIGVINLLFVLYLYIALVSPAERMPNSVTSPPLPMIGTGYFVLLFAAVVGAVLEVVMKKRS